LLFNLLSFLLALVGFFLSVWIVVPAPTFFWLPLSVGAPEVSPWLVTLNILAIVPLLWGKHNWLFYLALGLGVVGLILSCLPLSQLPALNRKAAITMQQTLGQNYLAIVPDRLQAQFRPQPFRLIDSFRGIAIPEVRRSSVTLLTTPDKASLTITLYRPSQVGNYPAVVAIYGGAWQGGKSTDNADSNRYLAAQGYAVWAIDYRHAPEYHYPSQIKDVQAVLQFIQTHAAEYETDAERMVLLGRSSGAHLAMLAAYQSSTIPIRAVVNFYGPVDLATAYAKPPTPDPINIRVVLERFLGGSLAQMPEQYRLASPITYVDRQLPPTLLIYGSRDNIVEARYGRQLRDRLQATGNQVVFIEIPWADHTFDAVFNGVSNQLALYYTERFIAWALRASPALSQ
jgi:acetyl esterase/lipase